jgi:hypothetical protein
MAANLVYDVTYGADDATYTDPHGQSVTFVPLCAQ